MPILEDMFGPSHRPDEFMQMLRAQQQAAMPLSGGLGSPAIRAEDFYRHPSHTETQNPKGTLALIKKSIKEIKAEVVSEEAQGRIRAKVDRLLDLGALAQATVLDTELRLRGKLARVQEWDYKVLPVEEIGRFENEHRMMATKDGIRIHIDPLETYQGNPESGDAKDRIIPDNVLDKLETSKDRQVFDKFSVFWVERVPDPLLLGSIDGCKDYFLIAEWGSDISFDDLTKGNE